MSGVTVDTNILISGIIFPHGKPFQLLELAREGKINLMVSDAILNEMASVLERKFRFPPQDIAEARRRIKAMARTVIPSVELDVIKEDTPDNAADKTSNGQSRESFRFNGSGAGVKGRIVCGG